MKKTELLFRQQHLLQKSAALRERAQVQSAVLIKPLWVLDQGKLGLEWLTRHPVWPASALLLVAVLRPRRTLVWGGRLWRVWKAYRSFKTWMLPKPQK